MRRLLFISVWTFAAFWGWLIGLSLGGQLAIVWLARHGPFAQSIRGHAALIADSIVYGGMCVGSIVFTVLVLLLGLRGRLPGTARTGDDPGRGSPVDLGDAPPPA